jgi:hypothetical protein
VVFLGLLARGADPEARDSDGHTPREVMDERAELDRDDRCVYVAYFHARGRGLSRL